MSDADVHTACHCEDHVDGGGNDHVEDLAVATEATRCRGPYGDSKQDQKGQGRLDQHGDGEVEPNRMRVGGSKQKTMKGLGLEEDVGEAVDV